MCNYCSCSQLFFSSFFAFLVWHWYDVTILMQLRQTVLFGLQTLQLKRKSDQGLLFQVIWTKSLDGNLAIDQFEVYYCGSFMWWTTISEVSHWKNLQSNFMTVGKKQIGQTYQNDFSGDSSNLYHCHLKWYWYGTTITCGWFVLNCRTPS